MDSDNVILRWLGRMRQQEQQCQRKEHTSAPVSSSVVRMHEYETGPKPSAPPPAQYSALPSLSFLLADQEEVTGGGVLARSSAGLQLVRSRPPLTLTAALPDALQVVARPAKEPGSGISSSTVLTINPSLTAMYTWPDRGHVAATLNLSSRKYTVGATCKGSLGGSIPPTTLRVMWQEEDQTVTVHTTSQVRPSHYISFQGTPHRLSRLSHIYTQGDWSSELALDTATLAPSVALTRKLPMADAAVSVSYDRGTDEVALLWRAARWAKLQVSAPMGLGVPAAGSSSTGSTGPMLSFTLDPA